MFESLVHNLQVTFSALGAFVGFWGFVQFAPCLWRVMWNQHLEPTHGECPYHASMGVTCLAMVCFAFARMNTLGVFPLGTIGAGIAYVVAMLFMVVVVALGIWAQGRRHEDARLQGWRTVIPGTPNLSRILVMMFIITLAFVAVGLLGIMTGNTPDTNVQ